MKQLLTEKQLSELYEIHGLKDNGHCGNCVCDDCGGSAIYEAGHGMYCDCEECI